MSLAPRDLGGSLRRLFVAEEARTFLRDELARMRDFLVGLSLAGRGSLGSPAMVTLPDGGVRRAWVYFYNAPLGRALRIPSGDYLEHVKVR